MWLSNENEQDLTVGIVVKNRLNRVVKMKKKKKIQILIHTYYEQPVLCDGRIIVVRFIILQ